SKVFITIHNVLLVRFPTKLASFLVTHSRAYTTHILLFLFLIKLHNSPALWGYFYGYVFVLRNIFNITYKL
ncbi:hypothetical protein ACILPE_10435, partial [Capnocytophaga canimorsus]|uniref:hypothetical protein n=1 Tax=Capnocytophaga canimorsus TaxID=28188 RepID=UPI0037CFF5C4